MNRLLCACLMFGVGCDDAETSLTPVDMAVDAGVDAAGDAALVDATVDATRDALPADAAADARPVDARPVDAAPADAAADAVAADAGVVDAGPDAAPADLGVDAGPPGPPNHGLDDYPYTCMDPDWMAGECGPGMGVFRDGEGNMQHIAVDVPIDYAARPPSSGAHRSSWGRWGEYVSLPPQRWIHNMEHGGIVFLYDPCAPPELVQGLRDIIAARPEGEELLWILAPYPNMDEGAAIAVVAWEWRYLAHCINAEEINLFVDRFHAMGPEAVAADGRYDEGFIGR